MIGERLSARPTEELTASELDELALARFWSNEPWRSVEARRAAHQRWLDEGDVDRAVRSAWFVFYEHWLVGEVAVAQGWLGRARRLVTDPDSVVAGWVALAEADVAAAAGDADEALEQGRRAVRIGQAAGDRDLLAMGQQSEGRRLIDVGRTREGLACLDEAMVAVIGNELEPLFVGWIYCNVISTCHAVGDLRRANEWSEAALRWCAELRDGLLYPGLCRVYAAQLARLRGEWATAERDARQACEDLLAFDERYAGAAHQVVGDVCRLQGRHDEADAFYRRASELGHDPQPGLALLRAGVGQLDEGLGALRSTVDQVGSVPGSALLPHLERLSAVVELADRAGDTAILSSAAEAAMAVTAPPEAGGVTSATSAGGTSAGEVAEAYALSIRGRVALALGTPGEAVGLLRRAVDALVDLGLPYEAACTRLQLASAAAASGDELTATMERASALAALERLGAVTPPVTSAPTLAGSTSTAGAGPLSGRELEVLALVAGGLTNRDVAARLHLSEHTVARHLSNIYTKLGVRTRTAAVSAATTRGLLATGQD